SDGRHGHARSVDGGTGRPSSAAARRFDHRRLRSARRHSAFGRAGRGKGDVMSWRFALRELYQRRGRSLLSLFSVAVAVASIVAVGSAASSTRAAYQRVFKALAGRADLEVVARGGGEFDQEFIDDVSPISGVRAVVPVFYRGTL